MSFIQARFRVCRFDVFSKDLQERTGAMRIKMGTVVPKMGTIVHLETVPTEYRQAIATALIEDLVMTPRL